MTVTEAPPESAPPPAAAARSAGRENWLDTSDHKRLGRLYLVVSFVFLAAGLVLAFVYPLPAGADRPDVWTSTSSSLGSGAVTMVFVLGIAPAWVGLATYLVPLQLGVTRLALPRLHALAWWLHAAGAVITTSGYIVDRPAGGGLGSPLAPAALSGEEANVGTQLWIMGLALVAVASVLAAVSLLTTILSRRAEGMRVRDVAPFTWSVLATSATLLLASPVFLAGLAILYVDQRGGGDLFAGNEAAAVWLKMLWLYGRPDVYLLVAPAVGVLSEAVATAARRPLFPLPAARIAIAGAALAGLLAWFARAGVAAAAVLPTYTVPAALAAIPFGLSVLVWLATLQQGKPRVTPGLLFAAAFAAILGLGSVMPVAAAFAGLEGTEASAFANGQLSVVVLGASLLGIGAAVIYWSPKLFGREAALGVAALALLALLGGTVVVALGQYLVAFGAGTGAARVSPAGFALLLVAVLLLAGGFVGRRGMAAADPYEGLTLEWLAASPPARHNFDELPPIRSAFPLYDARTAAGAGAAEDDG